LSVYDDGWCAVPAPSRSAEETSRRLTELVAAMVAAGGLFAAAAAVGALASSLAWLSYVLVGASALVLVGTAVRSARRRARERPAVFGSAAEQAAAERAATRVPLAAVRSVALHRDGYEDVVTVTLRRGRPLVYRSPDRGLSRLFGYWSPTPSG
jgi:hypothetical protein